MNTLSLPASSLASSWARAKPYLALAGAMVMFCAGASFAKQLFPMVGVPGTVAYRAGFSAVILLILFRPWRMLQLTRSDLLTIMGYGVALGLMNLCFYMALQTIPIGLALAIEFLGPLGVALIYSRRPIHFAAVGLAALGLALLLPIHDTGKPLDPRGVAFALCAALCWGFYIVFGKRTAHMPAGQTVSLGMAIAALVVVPIGIHTAGAHLLAPSLIVTGIILAVLSSAVPYSLEMVALKQMPATRFSVLMSGEPAVGALAGGLILGEQLSALQWLAIGLVVVASIVSVLANDSTRTAPELPPC